MGLQQQLGALLYKDYVTRKLKRHYIASLFELLLPVSLLLTIAYLGSKTGGAGSGEAPEWRGPIIHSPMKPSSTEDLSFYRFFAVPVTNPLKNDSRARILRNENALLIYSPSNSYTDSLMQAFYREGAAREFRGFKNEHTMKDFLASSGKSVEMAIVFDDVFRDDYLGYRLRFNASRYHFHTDKRFMKGQIEPRSASGSLTFEETHLLWPVMTGLFQNHLAYFGLDNDLTEVPTSPSMKLFPTPKYFSNPTPTPLSSFIPTFLSIGCIFFVIFFCKQIIEDKQSRFRELLRMMGLSDLVYWLNLLIVGGITMGIIITTATICFCCPLAEFAVLRASNPIIIFLVLFVFSVSAILQLLLITVFINSARFGPIVSIITWFLSLMLASVWLDPHEMNAYLTLTAGQKYMSSMLPCSGLYWCFKLVTSWEQAGVGVQWSNLAAIAHFEENITLMEILIAMVLSWFVYGFAIFYFDAVIPWQYGMPKSPLFLFKKSYWVVSNSKDFDTVSTTRLIAKDNVSRSEQLELFERPPPNSGEPVIALRDITQIFGHKKAVDDLSLDLYRNQITVMLGHNGAGKTTTMNILTGLLPPTTGQMYINGYSVRENTQRARQGIGLCPQHNVLFNELTVDEHLRFFAKIKGAPANEIEGEIVQMLEKFDLTPKRFVRAAGLSGGMKRKLCVANAMIGGSHILILDEPTAGMDPQARRGVWTILQEVRRTRTVLLTTHYMEEADVLGDRIAFLAAGKLKCAGSPMFLKKSFETGYNMRCAKENAETDVAKVLKVVHDHIGEGYATLASDFGLEFCINLGFPLTECLISLFRFLEDNKKILGIASLGVSVTTLEDVFLKVGNMDVVDGEHQPLIHKDNGIAVEIAERFPSFLRVHGKALWMNQFRALFMKRINAIKRQWFMPLFMIALPIIQMILFCYWDQKLWTANPEQEVLTYSFEHLYGRSRKTFGFLQQGVPVDFGGAFSSVLANDGVEVKTIRDSEVNMDNYLLDQASRAASTYKDGWATGATPGVNHEMTTLWFNGEPLHVGGAAIISWQSAILKKITGNSSAGVVARNQPLGEPLGDSNVLLLVFVRFASVFPISLATAFLTCSLVFFPIQERASKSQLVQMMSGVHHVIFFGASFLFDFLLILVSAIFMVIVCVLYDPAESFTTFPDTWGEFTTIEKNIFTYGNDHPTNVLFFNIKIGPVVLFFIFSAHESVTSFSMKLQIPVATWIVLFVYGFTMVPGAYLAAHFFESASTGFASLLCFSSLTGCVLVIIMSTVDMIGLMPQNPFELNLNTISNAIHILNYIPPFAVVWGLTNIHVNGVSKKFCDTLETESKPGLCFTLPDVFKACCAPCSPSASPTEFCFKHYSPFEFDIRNGAGYQILAMLITGFVAFVLLILMESNSQRVFYFLEFFKWHKLRNAFSHFTPGRRGGVPNISSVTTEEDVDVTREKRLVEEVVSQGRVDSYALVAHGLVKYYGTLKAVDDISFVVNNKECFGLLGVNGAGKTTTFGMLTGDLLLSDGNAYIKDSDLRTSVRKFQSYIGYCPQFDALLETLTGREMLELFCALRGVPTDRSREMVDFMIGMADLQEHANKPTVMYSGGNKRKLSIAIAMIGNPHVMFLDEPTAGVDPAARRKIWATLIQAQKEIGSAIILTSHSMEECEALCSRLCIMVNGSFRCLGSSQHLKSKFGLGFTVLIKLKSSADEAIVVPKVCAAMDQLFPGENKLKDNHQHLLHFHVTDLNLRWSQLFEKTERLKKEFDFEDILVSDTTLEQIFLAFAKHNRCSQMEYGAAVKPKTRVL